MHEIKKYCLYNDERTWEEALYKGYKNDIYVSINNVYYHLSIYDIVRLQQDFESETQDYGFYYIDPNLVLVREVQVTTVKLTIEFLFERRYFESIKPIETDDEVIQKLIQI